MRTTQHQLVDVLLNHGLKIFGQQGLGFGAIGSIGFHQLHKPLARLYANVHIGGVALASTDVVLALERASSGQHTNTSRL